MSGKVCNCPGYCQIPRACIETMLGLLERLIAEPGRSMDGPEGEAVGFLLHLLDSRDAAIEDREPEAAALPVATDPSMPIFVAGYVWRRP